MEVDPLSELLLTVESPEPVLQTFQNHLAAGTLEELSPVFSGKPITNSNGKCVDCGTMFSSDTLEHDKNVHKHHNQWNSNEGVTEEKLMNAKILTKDASPHLFKDFLDALDVINTNKDFLLKYIQDPGSPLPFHTHDHQQFSGGKTRRAKSISFPVSGSSSGTKDSDPSQQINQMVDDWFNAEERQRQSRIQSNLQKASMSKSISLGSSHKVDPQLLNPCQEWTENEKDHTFSPASSPRVPNHVKAKHFRDLRKKIKHIIEESKNEKYRITMDAILDKIPRGNRFSKSSKRLIHDQSKDPTMNEGEGNESATGGYGSRLSSQSFNKRQPPSNMRTSSLKDSVGRYSQLYETCFHSEAKYPKTESLKLRNEERSSILKTPKSFRRFLSLPNLKSYFSQQSEEQPSVFLTPQNSMRKYGDRIISSTSATDQQQIRFDHGEDPKIQILPPTLADITNQESTFSADQKQALVRSASKSVLDFNDEAKEDNKSMIGIDGLGSLRDSSEGGGACNEHDIGHATESSSVLQDANSAFSSDTSFLDVTFELENLNALEGIYIWSFYTWNIAICHS